MTDTIVSVRTRKRFYPCLLGLLLSTQAVLRRQFGNTSGF